ncbi:3-oxoacyl-ACP reductase FabG [Paludicola sp. MB14-C6]|uniref:elongation factor P 5-aminopentanone reductase n=1 Tax=Paludihabitans sp. MB14-C6 TaxID=3070656 RepID=UPI0027DB310A|nr:3-oxoacyl-ACP reductase FabG [Paludicola sp. MB14-C6]WMJ24392.1 3-oxoacyl-ACP reductase FabG [Paludicola sp. MB14-C6]
MTETVLVTGGAKGIGKACVELFAKKGYRVIIHYHTSKEQAIALANQLPNAIAVQADLRDANQIAIMMEKIQTTYGKVDVLVNNAGIAQQKLFTDITEQEWDTMFDSNVKGMFLLTKAALPAMIQQRYGKIVNISSIWGITGASCEVHYSASKAAIIGFTKALAKEVGLSNVNVNCVAPGVVMTDMMQGFDEQTLSQIKEETPLNRLGNPEMIANTVYFLATEQSEFITGQVISPNGGIVI